jgi:hypothetical protein
MNNELFGKIKTQPVDIRGKLLRVGQTVAKSDNGVRLAGIEIRKITRISDEGRVYLDNSNQPVRYPNRLAVCAKLSKEEKMLSILKS